MGKTEYELVWGVEKEKNVFDKCPNCESSEIERYFCGEYICNNCDKGFGICNLWNSKKYPIFGKSKKME